MVFDNRIEIVSPGRLPNGLTIESIKMGNAVARNNLLISYCSKMMNYRGFGSGIIRAIDNQDNIELINDESGEQFIVKIPRVAEHLRIPNTENVASFEENLDSLVGNLDSLVENLDSKNINLAGLTENLDSKGRKNLSKKELEELIIKNCTDYLSVEEISNRINRNINYLKNEIIPILIKAKKLEKLYPTKPNHPNQKYKAK
ncbi:MAG: hypothetical protein LBO74_06705 [Candidatus Symbiothrix sp.]|jgi:predicted HTH transcriptional regulator|nr:hypothetical protein [Candidatus Symbiothrix sp.]